MSLFGKLVSLPIRIINAPLVAMEKFAEKAGDFPPTDTRDGILCGPLESLAEAVEETADELVEDDK